jgi:hypothetical protein
MRNLRKLTIITLLIGLFFISCDNNQDKTTETVYVVTYNSGGECEDYHLELLYMSKDRMEILKQVIRNENLSDISVTHIFAEKKQKFIYFEELYKNCRVRLKESSKNEAQIELYIGDL